MLAGRVAYAITTTSTGRATLNGWTHAARRGPFLCERPSPPKQKGCQCIIREVDISWKSTLCLSMEGIFFCLLNSFLLCIVNVCSNVGLRGSEVKTWINNNNNNNDNDI